MPIIVPPPALLMQHSETISGVTSQVFKLAATVSVVSAFIGATIAVLGFGNDKAFKLGFGLFWFGLFVMVAFMIASVWRGV